MAGVKVIVDCKCLPSQPTGFYKLDVFARVYVCVSVWCGMIVCLFGFYVNSQLYFNHFYYIS